MTWALARSGSVAGGRRAAEHVITVFIHLVGELKVSVLQFVVLHVKADLVVTVAVGDGARLDARRCIALASVPAGR